MPELFVNGQQIVPIRGIPAHTGNYVEADDVAKTLFDPETHGAMAGVGLVGHYRDAGGVPHRMFPYEFREMTDRISAGIERGEPPEQLVAYLLPGIFVHRRDLERYLHGLWDHYTHERGAALDRGEFEFNPAPRMSAAEEELVYAGFEDLRTDGRLAAGAHCTRAERSEEVQRVLRRLRELAAAAGMAFDPDRMPGRRQEMVALLQRNSRTMMALTGEQVRTYINDAGLRFPAGRPTRDAPREHPLYALM